MKGYQYANLSQISHRFRVIVFQSNRDRIAYVYSTNDISPIHSQSIIPHVEQETENRYGTNFPSTLGDSPSSLISRNSLTTACRCRKDRFCTSMQSDNRQLISAKEDHDAPAKCTCTSSNLKAIIPASSSVFAFVLETIAVRMSRNHEEITNRIHFISV